MDIKKNQGKFDTSLYDLSKIKKIISEKDWTLERSMEIKTLVNGADTIEDSSLRNEFLKNRQAAFEKIYGLNSNDKLMHVLMVGGDTSGCGYVRIQSISKFLNRENDIAAFPTVVVCPELLSWAHIVVWQRQHKDAIWGLMKACKRLNRPQIFDIDDNLHAVEKNNPAYASYNKETQAYKNLIKWMNECDVVTTTKKELGDFYKKMSDTDYTVLPNSIDFELAPPCEPKKEKDVIRIGWAGSTTHYDDLRQASYGLKEIVKKYGKKVEIVLMGFDGKLRKAIKTENGVEIKISGDALDGIRREYNKPVKVEDYYEKLSSLDIDIGIIPLTRSEFNDSGKSNLKFLEFSALKIPCIVSKTPVYGDVVNGETGLIAKREGDWARHLETLINDEKLRHKIANNAYSYVRENFDLSNNIQMWANLYRQTLVKKLEEVKEKISATTASASAC